MKRHKHSALDGTSSFPLASSFSSWSLTTVALVPLIEQNFPPRWDAHFFSKYFCVIFVNNRLNAQFFFMYVYFYSLHVSDSYVPIIRRINCINTSFDYSLVFRVTYTRCRIDTINSPDDGHIAVRNMYRIEINIQKKKNCASSWLFTKIIPRCTVNKTQNSTLKLIGRYIYI